MLTGMPANRMDEGTTMTIGSGSGALHGHPGEAPAQTTAVAASRARSLPLVDYLTLGAIAVVVVLVSIPRLRSFVVRANEMDAMHMLRSLSAQPAPTGHEAMGDDLAQMVLRDSGLRRRLEDLECLDDGRLRRHGYLFDMTMLRPGEPMLRAWPWNQGQTGRGAFVWTPQRGLLGTANVDGRFSGPDHPPQPSDVGASWLRIPR
jgi:hypothetical protein